MDNVRTLPKKFEPQNNISPRTDIKGWGIDADPQNQPAFPMRKIIADEDKGITWDRPEKQEKHVEILHSTERPDLTAVFGTPNPPKGLSGILRRWAFKYSESNWGHWMILMLADRVDMVEGVFQDLSHGHIPNIFKERGLKSGMKYNRSALIKKTVITSAITLFVISRLRNRNR